MEALFTPDDYERAAAKYRKTGPPRSDWPDTPEGQASYERELAAWQGKYDNPNPQVKGEGSASDSTETIDELAPMAAVAHRLAEANPYRAFHFIPLINGDKPGDEGKIPFTDQWQTSGGVDLEDRQWRRATGYGAVLTDNRWLFIIDIDGDQHLTSEQRKAITDLPALTYRTRKGRHYLMGVTPDILPPMNSRTIYGGKWGELYYHAERQVALCGSANKHLPDNLTIPDAPIEAVQAAIKLLCPPGKKRTQEARADNYHDRLLRTAQRLVREGQTAEQIYETLKDSKDQAEAVAERSTADDDLKRIIRWCLDNTPAEDIDRWWPTPSPCDPIR